MKILLAPIPNILNPNFSNIVYWQNFLTDDDINLLLSLDEWNASQTSVIFDESNKNEKIRKSKNSWHYPEEKTKHIWEKILITIAKINSQYFQYDLTGCYEPMQLTTYSSDNDHYDWHTDFIEASTNDDPPRKLSMILSLSDPSEFDGGELYFKINNDTPVLAEQKKGRAWFFPSHILHKINPVKKGTRKSIVLWIGGPQLR